MSNLQFDQYAFAGRSSHPVDAEYGNDGWSSNGLSYDDFKRMRTVNSRVPRRAARWTPAFAASDEKLRRVLMQRAWTYLYGCIKQPVTGDWKTINVAATKKALEQFAAFFQNCPEHKRCEHEGHIAAVKRAGGYMELLTAVAYRAWRLGQDSVAVGESLGISPQSVRMTLFRICEAARFLGFETFDRHPSYRRKAKGDPQAASAV